MIATKFGVDMQGANGPDFGARTSRRYVQRAVESSLRRLNTDWIDLYQLHRPDPATPLEETLTALDELVTAGKVRYVGHCNLAGWQVADAAWTARHRTVSAPVSAQNHYSLLEREAEREIVPACLRFDVSLLPYFPLANGLLTGKYQPSAPPPPGSRLAGRHRLLADAPWDRVEALRGFAKERELDMATVAIGWLVSRPAVGSVIAGATSSAQVRANAAAAGWHPTEADAARIDELCPPGRR